MTIRSTLQNLKRMTTNQPTNPISTTAKQIDFFDLGPNIEANSTLNNQISIETHQKKLFELLKSAQQNSTQQDLMPIQEAITIAIDICYNFENFDFNAIDEETGDTYLKLCTMNKFTDAVMKLIELIPEKKLFEESENNIIYLTCKYDMEHVFVKLYKKYGKYENILFNNSCGYLYDNVTPLMWACANKMKIASLLLIKCCNSKPEHLAHRTQNQDFKHTDAFYHAEKYKMYEIMFELLKTGKLNVIYKSTTKLPILLTIFSTMYNNNFNLFQNILFDVYSEELQMYINDITNNHSDLFVSNIIKKYKKIDFKITHPKFVIAIANDTNNLMATQLLTKDDLKYL